MNCPEPVNPIVAFPTSVIGDVTVAVFPLPLMSAPLLLTPAPEIVIGSAANASPFVSRVPPERTVVPVAVVPRALALLVLSVAPALMVMPPVNAVVLAPLRAAKLPGAPVTVIVLEPVTMPLMLTEPVPFGARVIG